MKAITPAQLTKLHVLLRQRSIDEDEKRATISLITEGRTASSRALTMVEARAWIEHLEGSDPRQPLRAKAFALAYKAGIIWGDSEEDRKMNAAKINLFLRAKGAVKKNLEAQTFPELRKTLGQLAMILKHNEESAAKKATDALLSELGITSTPTPKAQKVA